MKPEDRLEKFIIEHRSELDSVEPPRDIWEKVASEVHSNGANDHRLSKLDWFWRAAAVLFFGITVYFVSDRFIPTEQEDFSTTITDQSYQEFINAEQYYSSIIQVKKEELNDVLAGKDQLNSDFSKDIAELDSMYLLLQKDYDINNDELVLDAMISNLRVRIEILDRQLQIIENINKIRANKDEGITI
ncbi:MAG: hypothetical protein HKN68_03975 [Saprospiraceae bacterium]|nr:hypothetical protein [Saprospiraceae bacterium]